MTMNKQLYGVVPPVVTPLDGQGNFDRASYEKLLNRMIEAGVHGLFVLGSTSEVVFSTDERREQIVRAAKEIIAGRVPLLVGAIDTETMRVVDQIKRLEDIGVDAIVATAPFYALGGPLEVERHFRIIKENSSLPIYAYDIPVCVHTKLEGEMLLRLGQEGVLAGVKDSSGDDVAFRFLALRNRDLGEPLRLFTGHEVVVDGAYLSGAHGSVPGLANIDPDGYVRQWDAYQRGDWQTVREEQDRLATLMTITSRVKGTVGFGAGVGAFKTALAEMGIISSNRMPEPVPALVGDDVTRIRQVLQKVGLL